MANWIKVLPTWGNPGIAPPELKRQSGWEPSDKPPAPWLNWWFHGVGEALGEIRTVIDTFVDETAVKKSGDTMTGKLILPASTTARAPFNIPGGVAPSSPVNGDIFQEGNDLKARLNALTRVILHSGNVSSYVDLSTRVAKTGDTMSGKLTAAASATGAASLNVPAGTAPTSPVNGDVWQAANELLVRLNGNSRTLIHTGNINTHADLSTRVDKAGDTMTGKLTLPAGNSSRASLRIVNGGAPTTPENGDIWGASSQLRAHLNGITQTLIHDGNIANFVPPPVSGASTFNSTTGRTIAHTVGHTGFKVIITPTANPAGLLGEVWYTKTTTNFTVFCSGSAATAFEWILIRD